MTGSKLHADCEHLCREKKEFIRVGEVEGIDVPVQDEPLVAEITGDGEEDESERRGKDSLNLPGRG